MQVFEESLGITPLQAARAMQRSKAVTWLSIARCRRSLDCAWRMVGCARNAGVFARQTVIHLQCICDSRGPASRDSDGAMRDRVNEPPS